MTDGGIERGFDQGNSATLFWTAVFHFVAFLLRTGVAKIFIRTSEPEVFFEGPPLNVECCAYIIRRRHVWNVSLVYSKDCIQLIHLANLKSNLLVRCLFNLYYLSSEFCQS